MGMVNYGLIYLATPYSKYPFGIETAFRNACRLTARLLQHGLKVYSPIAHCHPVAIHGKLSPLDHKIWIPFNEAILNKSDTLFVATMESWENSFGIAHEIKTFRASKKPIFHVDPSTLEISSLK